MFCVSVKVAPIIMATDYANDAAPPVEDPLVLLNFR